VSLRRRLLLIVVLSGAVLAGAAIAIARLIASSDASRMEAAQSMTDDVAEAIAAEAAKAPSDPHEARRYLERAVSTALSSARRVVGGVCAPHFMSLRAGARREGVRPMPIPPDHAAAIHEACKGAKTELVHARERIRGETLIISIASAGEARTWAATPIRTREGLPDPWKIAGGVLALATVALVLLTLDAMFALERGARSLDRSLDVLGDDLAASIETPRANELARIAEGLRRLAVRLGEAQQRERALSESLAHEQRLAALGRVAAGVAHEVRNPLAGMKLRLDMMKREPELSAEARDDVEVCISEIDRLNRLVQTILGAAKRDPQVREGVSLGSLVDQRIAGRPIVREGDATISTDPDLLAQVLDNLMRNALEASDDVRVAIAQEGDRARIAIIDRGPGVPAEKSAELFEPFFTTKGDGTGLGLFISRSLVRALGGTLEYRRDDDQTHFVIHV
jgi:signal transduction histidine kinase